MKPGSCPSRSMPTNDRLDTCVSLICPGSNHEEHVSSQSRAFLKETRSPFLPPSQTNADQFRETPASDGENTDPISASGVGTTPMPAA